MAQDNKRMVYIYEENLDFYNGLKNKSEFFNEALKDARLQGRVGAKNPDGTPKHTAHDPYEGTDYHPDPRIEETKRRVAEMDELKKRNAGK